MYDLIEFFKNRKIRCFMTSSSILIRTYVFCCTSIKNQFAFSFNLLRIADNQSSMMRFLSSVKIYESSNFLNVETVTSPSMINKNIFEFFKFLSRNSIFNSRIMNCASFNSFSRLLYFSMNSSNFITFLLYSFMTKMFSSRMFIHVLIKTFSSLFNQYFN